MFNKHKRVKIIIKLAQLFKIQQGKIIALLGHSSNLNKK